MTKCAICRAPYERRYLSHKTCGDPICRAEQKRQEALKKADRAELKARKEKIKSRSDWAREAQSAINAFIRERDRDLPCVSCGRHHTGQYHCGHFLSRGAHPELAYEEMNLAKQCAPCNTHLSGNQINFRKGLIERIGIFNVEWLEGPHEAKKYTAEELREIRDHYRAKLRELKRQEIVA